jgi:serine/threonine-protein kinase
MELGEHEGLLYLVMEWVDGEPLGFLLDRAGQRGGMPLPVAVALISQVLAGLHAAHELSDESGPLGVVHRDVSPHNILVTYDGIAKLLDFGIAKATHQTSPNTEAGEVKGKFSYMAPEQILGGEVDRRCDVFAAGIVLYLLTTGRHPFKRGNTAAIIHAITTDDPVAPPSTLIEDFPADLERVLLKALEKDVEKRWSSADEMRTALEQAMPSAFGDAARSNLRIFMERVVGDRKVARREAVRRAQLTADGSDVTSGERQALQTNAQSASSLRAISISQPAPEEVPELIGAPTSQLSQLAQAPAPAHKRYVTAPWLAATAGVMLALGALAPRLFTSVHVDKSAASGVQPGTPITPATTGATEPSPAVTAAPVASPSAVLPAPVVASQEPRLRPVAPSAKPAPARTPKPVRAATKPGRDGSSAPGAGDLLAPDYAR